MSGPVQIFGDVQSATALRSMQTDYADGDCGYDAVTRTFLFNSAKGNIPYDPVTGLISLPVGKFRLEGALTAHSLGTEFGDNQWYDEAGNPIRHDWTANGSAQGNGNALIIGPDFGIAGSRFYSQSLAAVDITVTAAVRVRLSLQAVPTNGFNCHQRRSFLRVTELPVVREFVNGSDAVLPSALLDGGESSGLDANTLVQNAVYKGNNVGVMTNSPTGEWANWLRVRRIGDWVEQEFWSAETAAGLRVKGPPFWRNSFDGGATWTPWLGG
ncbi:MAG: hypothetical protein ACR2RL_21740 [Gammaproteobacteria bacterium]